MYLNIFDNIENIKYIIIIHNMIKYYFIYIIFKLMYLNHVKYVCEFNKFPVNFKTKF